MTLYFEMDALATVGHFHRILSGWLDGERVENQTKQPR